MMTDEHLISLQPGTVISGRYEVVKCLGQGSMGLVYACRHRELAGLMVAVKVLFPEVAQDKIAAQRFNNEVVASYGVSHPNVVRAYDLIRDGDLVAYTMEYVGGGDLAERLGHSGRRIPIPEAIRLLCQMCAGVQAIHDAGIVHRDLKPENILLTKEGAVKIADFGIARVGHGPRLTEHGGVVGTIDYVSPEYMLNSQVDWRSDIYALGILAYEMITGESPFRGDSVYATMTKRLKCDPAPPSSLRPECPAEMDRIILKAMHRDPEQRYQSAGDIFEELQALGREMGVEAGSHLLAGSKEGRSRGAMKGAADEPQAIRGGAGGPKTARPRAVEDEEIAQPVPGPAVSKDPLGETQILDPGISRKPAARRSQPPEPARVDRVLAYDDLVSGGWQDAGGPAKGIQISQAGIDSSRMRKLSEMADQRQRSVLADLMTLIVAIVFGVGIGFGVLKVFFPDVMSRQMLQSSQTGATGDGR